MINGILRTSQEARQVYLQNTFKEQGALLDKKAGKDIIWKSNCFEAEYFHYNYHEIYSTSRRK